MAKNDAITGDYRGNKPANKRGKRGTTGGNLRIVRAFSREQRDAAQQFLDGFWVPSRRNAVGVLLSALWRDYQSEPEYETLRQGLVDAARERGGRE